VRDNFWLETLFTTSEN